MVLWVVFNVLATIACAIVATTIVLLVWLMVESGLLWVAVGLAAFLALAFVWVLRGKKSERAASQAETEGVPSGLG